MLHRNGELNGAAWIDVQLLLPNGLIQHIPQNPIFLMNGGGLQIPTNK
jgi:hypothetical protein